ncbi:S-layer homology domain-containing protein [Acetoanaerobium noterae]|uniref:S-layer homology domain-containing protein n=1 Tax=Acetoanaerobium noterae TaxID=745369 RepID=UPI0028AF301D|nr:S-layer homology domain-containing protein [Acetoanaerobium noterae]
MKYKAFKQKLSIALAAMMIMTSASTVSFAAGFSDLSQASWAKATIEEWTQKGLVSGYLDGTFRPSNHITRAEFATLVQKAFDLKSEAKSEFSDVASSDWYYDAIATLASLGVVGGYEDGTFRPAGHITRAEAAAIMTNLKKLNPNASAAEKFADYASMADWAKGHVGAVVEAKFMSGYPDGTFKASNTITRAESVATLNNVINPGEAKANLVIDNAGTYGGTEVDYQMVKGTVTVNVADVTLKNMVIDGDLILAEGIGEGEVTLENVTVKGDTHVLGGGANSIYIKNSKMAKIFVNKKNGQIRIVAQGTSTFGTITAQSGVKLEEQNLINSEGFAEIVIDENAKGEIVLEGNFSKITVKAEGITLRIPEGSSVGELKIEKKISVVGTGTIEKAIIYVNGVTFEKAPLKVESGTKSPITIVVGGTEQTVTPPSTGGGGGGGGSTTPVAAQYKLVLTYKNTDLDGSYSRSVTLDTYSENTIVDKEELEDSYDSIAGVLSSELSDANGLITKVLNLESDNGNKYSQSIAAKVIDSGISFAALGWLENDDAILERLADGTATNQDVKDLAEALAQSSFGDIEAMITYLYGDKTISDIKNSDLEFMVYDQDIIDDYAESTLSEVMEDAFDGATAIKNYNGKSIFKISLGTTSIEINVVKK